MDFELHQTVWITLSCGTRLAAAVWLPEGPGPFPAVLEYLPYRRGDGTAIRDQSTYPAYARAGIAGVRVDSRGQGDSEGFFDDEYSPQEMSDAVEVIDWIADQRWSNGAVGMMGISWGGFNGLQVAALRPPALKAVISIASTADRYNDDIHYKGGSLLSANISWAATMLSYSSRPPDPAVVGNGWAEIWEERLARQPMLLETWLRHPHRDSYWQHGSICEDWSAIQCPVWVIAGWGDGYRNTPATIAANLKAPVKATTGPWVHKYPHFAYPHPRLDFLTLSTDWWLRWLADEPRGVDAWPHHLAYRIEAARPGPWRDRDDGTWLDLGPGPGDTLDLALGDGVLGTEATVPVAVATPQHCGLMAGEYFALAPNGDLPADQRAEDALSECWEMAVDAPLDLAGRPVLNARVAIDRPQGNLIARLVDVHPDGTSALIARGVLNLCHRDSQADPQPMVPGQAEQIALALDECCYRVRPGHRLRLALSTAYFPLVIPSPAPVTASIEPGAVLNLPLAPAGREIQVPEPADPAPLPEFAIIDQAQPGARRASVDLNASRASYLIDEDSGLIENPANSMRWRETRREVWQVDPANPTECTGTLTLTAERRRDAWQAETRAVIRFSTTAETFEVSAEVTGTLDGKPFHQKDWAFSVPRRCV